MNLGPFGLIKGAEKEEKQNSRAQMYAHDFSIVFAVFVKY